VNYNTMFRAVKDFFRKVTMTNGLYLKRLLNQ